jgi:hypothetical protein
LWAEEKRRSSAALQNIRVTRAILGEDYFGASEATILWKHGSPRTGLDFGSNLF